MKNLARGVGFLRLSSFFIAVIYLFISFFIKMMTPVDARLCHLVYIFLILNHRVKDTEFFISPLVSN